MRSFLQSILTLAAAGTLAVCGRAATITFDTAPGCCGSFGGPVTENGFTYSLGIGTLFLNSAGNPGQDMEGYHGTGGGGLQIVSASAGNFMFSAVDYAAFSSTGTGSQTLLVQGFLGATLVGMEQYTLANSGGAYNWTTESASNLAGKTISTLLITLNANTPSGNLSWQSIDNVVLTSASAPEPGTFMAGLAALAGLWIGKKRFLS